MQILFDRVTDLAVNQGTLKSAVLALLLLFAVKVLQQVIKGIDNFVPYFSLWVYIYTD
ncbi:hypothetical protein [Abyssisolibacter fermentans]|uniref:hypothetical protein n=1 Tax=Abyssisolibacter fermentans TaxID=1766203 RepID=UPI0012E3C452|nr:hypothetical protein [Abyssisolibacter fermentans]